MQGWSAGCKWCLRGECWKHLNGDGSGGNTVQVEEALPDSPKQALPDGPKKLWGAPPDFVKNLKETMLELSGSSGIICKYGHGCTNAKCKNGHPQGRAIEEDPKSIICRFKYKCLRKGCYFVHPRGREIDDDPSKGACPLGEDCTNPTCIFTHPGDHKRLVCKLCGETGHLVHTCTKQLMITIGNLSCEVTEEELQKFCEQAGVVKEVRIARHMKNTRNKNDFYESDVGYCDFYDECTRQAAIDVLHGQMFCGRKVHVRDADRVTQHAMITGFPNWCLDLDHEELIQRVIEIANTIGEVQGTPEVVEGGQKVRLGFRQPLDSSKFVEFEGSTLEIIPCSAKEALASARDWTQERARTIFIGNLSCDCSEKDLLSLCSEIGEVESVQIRMKAGKSQGFAHCMFASSEAVQDAVARLNDLKFLGFRLRVKLPGLVSEIYTVPKDIVGLLIGKRGANMNKVREASGAQIHQCDEGFSIKGHPTEVALARQMLDDLVKTEPKKHDSDDSFVYIHVDELGMPLRPVVEPSPADCEVWLDPLPGEESEDWVSKFGEVSDVFPVGNVEECSEAVGQSCARGYVKFKEHEAAKRCVEAGIGVWSESERILASQMCSETRAYPCAYPKNVVFVLLGKCGFMQLKDEIGLRVLSLRGEGLHNPGRGESYTSTRLHFACKGDFVTVAKAQPALELMLAEAHRTVSELLLKDPSEVKELPLDGMAEGEWKCESCGNGNWSMRAKCRRCGEGALGLDYHKTLSVPKDLAGKIMGTKCRNIARIAMVSGTKIDVSDNEDGEHVDLKVSGFTEEKTEEVYEALQTFVYASSATEDLVKEVLSVPIHLAGEIIGKNGANINKICKKTGAKIDAEDNENGEHTDFFIGASSSEACAMARHMLQNIRSLRPGVVSEIYTVPKDVVGRVIGPRGAFINEVVEASGAQIDQSDNGEQIDFCIKGYPKEIALARHMLDDLAAEVGSPRGKRVLAAVGRIKQERAALAKRQKRYTHTQAKTETKARKKEGLAIQAKTETEARKKEGLAEWLTDAEITSDNKAIVNPPEYMRTYSSVWQSVYESPSTEVEKGKGAARSMLDSEDAWCPATDDIAQWITIDLGSVLRVCGVVTQGAKQFPRYVKRYELTYSTDNKTWTSIATFEGNCDLESKVRRDFAPVSAQYVRFEPLSWCRNISMRAAVVVQPVENNASLTCGTCGAIFRNDDNFCAECGAQRRSVEEEWKPKRKRTRKADWMRKQKMRTGSEDNGSLTFKPGPLGINCIDGVVTDVYPGSQAQEQGIQVGWRLAGVNGHPCTSFGHQLFQSANSGHAPFQLMFEKPSPKPPAHPPLHQAESPPVEPPVPPSHPPAAHPTRLPVPPAHPPMSPAHPPVAPARPPVPPARPPAAHPTHPPVPPAQPPMPPALQPVPPAHPLTRAQVVATSKIVAPPQQLPSRYSSTPHASTLLRAPTSADAPTQAVTCACGQMFDPEDNFCMNCGAKRPEPEERSKASAQEYGAWEGCGGQREADNGVQQRRVTFQPRTIGMICDDCTVSKVLPGSQAEQLGVRRGWRLVAVRDRECQSFAMKLVQVAQKELVPFQVTFEVPDLESDSDIDESGADGVWG